jgi:hypothetical protein
MNRTLPLVIIAAVLATVAFGQTNAGDPIMTTLCDIVKAPEQFNGKMVQVQVEYVSKFQWTGLKDGSCSASVPLGVHHPIDDLNPEQGEYAFTTLEWAVVVPGDGEMSPAVTSLLDELSARGITIHDSRFEPW